jgi:hypothetical protein
MKDSAKVRLIQFPAIKLSLFSYQTQMGLIHPKKSINDLE